MSKIDLSGLRTTEQKAAESAHAEQQRINAEARAYLSSTDWYVTRRRETGQDVPPDIAAKRQAARDRVIDIN
ncbi:MAG: hypothetical protein ABN482_01565 [Corticimicrobacter sp.]|uniref:hypothetical protein n=1 Tax=Corticimicrobacter sp. TaxID=2678536 RepID=UPI0032DB1CE3